MDLKISNLDVINIAVGKRIGKLVPVFKQAVGVEKDRIQSRTQQGIGFDGKKFSKYSAKWKKARQAAGLQTAHVDLTYTGDMFRAFKLSFLKGEASITGVMSFGSESYKVEENEALGRGFFGLTDEQIEIIKTKLRQAP
jgi:hypothetical protein